ncbi:hypothetical protein RhiXN_11523 [Rhizoctonia solani]|uniref:Uncharacterized protein n=1 Tax=Rhizoctonia solani TaxID=456999 RepID=A0A8H8SZS3_9AGAM|nr:uncharacterized protein RhiXN_11523 [Rhizoctonia solani]QRW24611.1 hypothetical protein RhiXN_11523 [Rhizoctonia solani]
MTLTISYEPPEGGRPWYADVEPSESYEGVINAACALWKNRLPSDECIIGRYLARQIKRHGEIEWARISEARFIQLVRDSPEELELRLELDTQIGRRHYRETSTPSSLEMPPPILNVDSNNPSHTWPDGPTSAMEVDTNNKSSAPMPLTPMSLIDTQNQREQTDTRMNRAITHVSDSSPNPDPNPGPTPAPSPTARNPTYEAGLTAFFAGRFDEARIRFQLAADECRDTGDAYQEAECLLRLGMTCRHLKDYPNAVSHLSSARRIYDSLRNCQRELLSCERSLARVSEDQGKYEEALLAYQEIRSNARAIASQTEEAWCDYFIGRLHNRRREYEDARRHLSSAITTSKALNNQEIEAYATEESGHSAERQQHRDRL